MCWCLSIIELKNARWNIEIQMTAFLNTDVYEACLDVHDVGFEIKKLFWVCRIWLGMK